VTSSLIVCKVDALIFMVTKIVGAVAGLGIGTRHTDVTDEISKHLILSIMLNFVLNMTELGSFETSLTFRHRASYIYDDRSANIQMLHFIYLFNKYKY
jgi:hypothetical protein